MKEMIKMVVVLTILSAFSGGLLAKLKDETKDRIEVQELQLVKGPAVQTILDGAENDPVTDRFKIMDGESERSIFVGVFDGVANTIAFEVKGKGYGDEIGLMLGINVNQDKLVGIGVTTHKETPGLGGNAKDDPSFSAQFKGLSLDKPFLVTKDGGGINAISGATITSRAVCMAATDGSGVYQRIKAQISDKLKEMSK
ncbi:MAG: FMN-binding protein [Deltaproteobacteria bacterium]|nr:FMN-binding protein [Deltaproteobacteria bacterium]